MHLIEQTNWTFFVLKWVSVVVVDAEFSEPFILDNMFGVGVIVLIFFGYVECIGQLFTYLWFVAITNDVFPWARDANILFLFVLQFMILFLFFIKLYLWSKKFITLLKSRCQYFHNWDTFLQVLIEIIEFINIQQFRYLFASGNHLGNFLHITLWYLWFLPGTRKVNFKLLNLVFVLELLLYQMDRLELKN